MSHFCGKIIVFHDYVLSTEKDKSVKKKFRKKMYGKNPGGQKFWQRGGGENS